jgi:hypothetical protein
MTSLAVIVPSRGRPQNIKDLIYAMNQTKTTADLWVVCDDDDPELAGYQALGIENLLIFNRTQKGMARPLNLAVRLILQSHKYSHFAFLGDDHRPRTMYWDLDFTNVLDQGLGMVYGNDLFQGENLPTAIGMHGTIVRELNGMVPEGLFHLYLDNFWKQIGLDIGALTYLPETIIEHMHPLAGKAQVDQGYVDVNAPEIYDADKIVFDAYIDSDEYRALVRRLI